MPIEYVKTPAIAANAATVVSELCEGFCAEIRVDVRTSAGAASSNTCDVAIVDNVFGRTLLTVTGITGIENFYDPSTVWESNAGIDSSINKPFYLANQRFTVTVANGTNTEYVEVWMKLIC